ncbi:hypothetical protein [Variovorax sp. 22077]|uniref:hypothetical protein n=1 Tax=Variovorax sp. 22077 TaxID=3453867 RepID=UPI003F874752
MSITDKPRENIQANQQVSPISGSDLSRLPARTTQIIIDDYVSRHRFAYPPTKPRRGASDDPERPRFSAAGSIQEKVMQRRSQ